MQSMGGMMIHEEIFGPKGPSFSWPCLICGEVVDQTIIENRIIRATGGVGQKRQEMEEIIHVDRMAEADTSPCFLSRVLLGCFASFSFDFCSCLFIFCFRPLSLSFLPLSPIRYLLFPLTSSSRRVGALRRQCCLCVLSSLSCDGWNEWLGTMFTKDDFLFLDRGIAFICASRIRAFERVKPSC